MAVKPLPSVEMLRQLVSYDPETGLMAWKQRPVGHFATVERAKAWNSQFADAPAFKCLDRDGYRYGTVAKKQMRAHRVAWAIHYDEWPDPEMHIDHINGDKADNRIANLRLASPSQNAMNIGKRSNNTSGFKGVVWNRAARKWQAGICVRRKLMHLGMFDSAEDAARAYEVAAANMHGEFSRL